MFCFFLIICPRVNLHLDQKFWAIPNDTKCIITVTKIRWSDFVAKKSSNSVLSCSQFNEFICVLAGRCTVHTFDHDCYQLSCWNSSSCWQFCPHWRVSIRISTWICVALTSSIWMARASPTTRACTCEIQIHAIPNRVILYCSSSIDSWVRFFTNLWIQFFSLYSRKTFYVQPLYVSVSRSFKMWSSPLTTLSTWNRILLSLLADIRPNSRTQVGTNVKKAL